MRRYPEIKTSSNDHYRVIQGTLSNRHSCKQIIIVSKAVVNLRIFIRQMSSYVALTKADKPPDVFL